MGFFKKTLTGAALALCLALLPAPALADGGAVGGETPAPEEHGALPISETLDLDGEPTYLDMGACGEELTYAVTADYYLLIVGEGDMYDYALDASGSRSTAPWAQYAAEIRAISVGAEDNGVTSVGRYAFYGLSSAVSVRLCGTITTIGDGAFYGCAGLGQIELPQTLTSIGQGAFFGCSGITAFRLPAGLRSIGELAFGCCEAIAEFSFPEGIPEIPAGMLAGCAALETVTIPADVRTIGAVAFADCDGLQTVRFGGTRTQWNSLSFGVRNEPLQNARILCGGEDDSDPYAGGETDRDRTARAQRGDVDGDGAADDYDAALILRWSVGLLPADSLDIAGADVDGDGAADDYDAALILRYCVGLIPSL